MTRWIPVMVSAAALAAGGLLIRTPGADAGGGCHAPLTDTAATTVDMRGACFVDTIVRVAAGATVTWTNSDPVDHTVTGAGLRSGTNGWGSFETVPEGGTFTHRFDDDGLYLYYCVLHPSMIGAVVVGDGGAAAASHDGSDAAPASDGGPGAGSDGASATDDVPGAVGDVSQRGVVFAMLGAGALAALVAVGAVVRGRWTLGAES
jgi:plastocyanin